MFYHYISRPLYSYKQKVFTLSCIQAAGREIGLNSALLTSLYIEQAKGLNSNDMNRWIYAWINIFKTNYISDSFYMSTILLQNWFILYCCYHKLSYTKIMFKYFFWRLRPMFFKIRKTKNSFTLLIIPCLLTHKGVYISRITNRHF